MPRCSRMPPPQRQARSESCARSTRSRRLNPEGRLAPALRVPWSRFGRYPTRGASTTFALELKTCSSLACTSLARMVARQSALLFGSLSWSPWYEVCPVHWFATTTNLTCVAGGAPSALKYRSVSSGVTGRGLTDGNAFNGDLTISVQPAATEPSHVGFAALPAVHE